MNKQLPKVPIEKMELQENDYVNYGKRWSAVKLIEHSKKYETFDLPLVGLDLSRNAWKIESIDDFIFHVDRCVQADLNHPIILDHYGCIADGMHRIAKAIVRGRKTIKAIRLETMPDPDSIEDKE